jgi:hypothetical protein
MSWMNQVHASPVAAPAPKPTFKGPTADELEAASAAFAARLAARNYRDDFAAKFAVVAQDLADNLRRFGTYVSQKQADFAAKVVGWSQPKPAKAPALSNGIPMEKTFEAMQRLSKITFETLQIARKNQASLCWIKHPSAEGVIGKIEDGTATLFPNRIAAAGLSIDGIKSALREIEADPVAAAAKYGKLSGRCSCCGRDLTDPESIALGIGPICYTRLAG